MKFGENLRWWFDFSIFFGSFDIDWPIAAYTAGGLCALDSCTGWKFPTPTLYH